LNANQEIKLSSKHLKIAILVHFFPPKYLGGTEIATYNLAKYLCKKGHEVHVITTLYKGAPKKIYESGFHIHRLFWSKIRFIGGILFLIKQIRCLKNIDPDVIHFQGAGGINIIFLKKFFRRPCVAWGQGSDIYSPWSFKNTILKSVFRNVDAVVALTEDMKKDIQKIFNRAVFVIPNGIDNTIFKKISSNNHSIDLSIKKRDNMLIFVGNFRPVKGLKYLIYAMKLINEQSRDVGLILIGDGEKRLELEKLVKTLDLSEYIFFIGKVSNEQIPKYMHNSDIFVLPSLSEGLPLVILEAFASGLPIVASKVGGLPSIIKDGENGFLVEPKNPEKIVEKIMILLKNKKLMKEIAKNNKLKAEKYDWSSVSNQIESVYFEVIDNKS